MNSLFGDATSQMPTPATLAEAESLFSGHGSPVPSLDIRRGPGIDNAIPGLDINPPPVQVEGGKPQFSKDSDNQSEGVGGWISNLVKRSKGNGEGDSQSGSYRRVNQDDE